MIRQVVLELAPGQQASEWIRLLPWGEIELVDGREPMRLNRQGAQKILAAWVQRKTDLVVDYEHQSLTGQEAPAAGWIKDIKSGTEGLYVQVEWTERARKYLEAREYRYFSPVVQVDDAGNIVGLLSVALTNTPAMAEVPALAARATEEERAAQAARARRYGIGVKETGNVTKPAEWAEVPDAQWGDPVNYRYPCHTAENARAAWSYWNMPKNRRDYSEAEQKIITDRIKRLAKKQGITIQEENMKQDLVRMLKLADDVEDGAVVAAVAEWGKAAELVAELGAALGLTTSTPATVKGAVLALKAGQDRLSVVEQELQALKAERQQERARQQVEAAVQAGKLTPAQREWALSYALSDPEGFGAYVAAAPVVVPVDSNKAEAQPGGSTVALTAEERQMCRALGITVEQFKAQREKEKDNDGVNG